MQSINKLLKNKLTINSQSYWDFLTFRYIPGISTSYNEIKKIEPGNYITINQNKVITKSYWNIQTNTNLKKFNEDQINKDFSYLFRSAVKKRLISDVPIGVVLSGGLDSAAVLYEASRQMKIDSYHVMFDNTSEDYNESKYAKKIAKYCNSKINIVKIDDKNFIDSFINMPSITDEPISDLSSIPFKYVCDLASKEVKVVLSGEGSDEILGGYGLENVLTNLNRLKLFNKYPHFSKFFKYLLNNIFNKNLDILNDLGVNLNEWPKYKNYNITNQIDQKTKEELFLNNKFSTFRNSKRITNKLYNDVKNSDSINQILYVISHDWLVENILMKSDKVSMSSSIEMRCPFLDFRLVEYLFNLNGNSKIKHMNGRLQNKYILKQYMKNKIPSEIIQRRKLGFPVPAYEFKDSLSKDFAYDTLGSGNNYYQNIFEKKKIIKYLDKAFLENNTKNFYFIWSLLTFEMWYNNQKNN